MESSKVKCEGELGFEDFVRIAKRILELNGVDKPIVVRNGKAVDNVDTCIVLKKLGVTRLPVSEVSEEAFISLDELGFYEDVKPSVLRIFQDTEELLYRNWPTPLVKLARASAGRTTAWAKLEFYNPWSMSVKDRIGWYMYKKACEKNMSSELKFLVEATSTNTGLAIAAMCNMHGSKLRAYIPATVSETGELLLKIFGAEVTRVPKPLTVDLINDVEACARIEGAVHLNQFYNDANFEVHLRYTAKELDLQLREAGIKPVAIIGGLGTSGHLSALSVYFKSKYKSVKVYGVVPARDSFIQGIRCIESGMKWLHYVQLDGIVEASLDEAVEGVLRIVRSEGILVGLSSGAVYSAYRKLVETGELESGDCVLVFPDHGFKYVEVLAEKMRLHNS